MGRTNSGHSTQAEQSASRGGKFPDVVDFARTEPTTEKFMTLDNRPIAQLIDNIPDLYSPYTSFAGYRYTTATFNVDLSRALILSIAQQIVHAHQNMTASTGPFGPVIHTDIHLPSALRAAVQQLGEFSVPALGFRFLYKSYDTLISALVFAASKVSNDDLSTGIAELWLPMNATDLRTKFILASRLAQFMFMHNKRINIEFTANDLVYHLLVQEPAWYTDEKAKFPNPTRFDFLFTPKADMATWVAHFTGDEARAALMDLHLTWANPAPSDLDFTFDTISRFDELIYSWLCHRKAIESFMFCGSSAANRASAVGSAATLSSVNTTDVTTTVHSLIRVSQAELSLIACFPLVNEANLEYGHRVVTAVSMRSRAIALTQSDWRT